VFEINEHTQQFINIPLDYSKKDLKMCHPLNFNNKEVNQLQNRFMRDLENFREAWITKEHISLPISVLTDDGKQSTPVGCLTFYRTSRDGKYFSSVDKIFLRILGFCLSYIIYTCKERQRVKTLDRAYSTFATSIPDIVKNSDISQMLIKLRLCLVDVFKSEDCAVILWDKVDKVFIALNPGCSLADLRKKKNARADISKFSNALGITGEVYREGTCMVLDKPRLCP
jgi:hypothetical protein